MRLTGVFLRDTGQQAGGEGQSRWQVVACDCRACGEWEGPDAMPLVAVNEPHSEIAGRQRHIAAWNLEIVGAAPRAGDYP